MESKLGVDGGTVSIEALCHNRRKTPPRGGTIFQTPSPDCLSSEYDEYLQSVAMVNAAHTISGLLQIIGRLSCRPRYPHKNIGKIRKASYVHSSAFLRSHQSFAGNLNYNSRGFSSPEEAQDYLWVSQSLWIYPAYGNG
jgi:hypothetical protein